MLVRTEVACIIETQHYGDSERKAVIAVRLGATLPICFQWYLNRNIVGKKGVYMIGHGDLYAMSEKATGCDWKTRKKFTLRHSAGCEKYTGKIDEEEEDDEEEEEENDEDDDEEDDEDEDEDEDEEDDEDDDEDG